jgi:hypothetical protein
MKRAKTRDLAKATLDRWIHHLKNPDNLKGKTAAELAKELLTDLPSFRKQGRSPGGRRWATEAKRLEMMGDMRKAWEDCLESIGESRTAWRGSALAMRKGKLPSARRAAHLVQAKYPEKYPEEQEALEKQFQYYLRSRLGRLKRRRRMAARIEK